MRWCNKWVGTAAGKATAARAWSRFSLIQRLAISCGMVVVLLSSVLTGSVVRFDVSHHSEDFAERLDNDLTALAGSLTRQANFSDDKGLAELLGAFAKRPGVEHVAWTNAHGGSFAFDGAPIARAAPAWFEEWAELPEFAATRGIVVDGIYRGQLALRLSPAPLLNDVWTLAARRTATRLAAAGVLLVIMLLIVQYSLRPMAGLVSAAHRFGNGEFNVRLEVAGSPEIASGIRAFNVMADRVGALVEALRDSEARNRHLAAIVEQSSESILTCDLNGNVLSWNKSAERLFGWSASEAIGRPVRELHLRGLSNPAYAHMLDYMCSAQPWAGEGSRVTKSGARMQVSGTHAPLLDESGKLIGAIAIARDISSLHEAQQALERANESLETRVRERTEELSRNEALLLAVMNAMPGVVIVLDAERRFRVFNRQLEDLLDQDADAIRGKTTAEATGEENHRAVQSQLDRAFAGHAVRFGWRYRVPDGSEHDLDTSLVPVLAADGASVAGVASFSMDVTQRNRASAALRDSQARNRVLATMVEQASDSILARDVDGNVTYWNKGAEQLHGFSAQEALGQPMRSLHMRGLSDEELAKVLERIRSGKPTLFEAQRLTKAGKLIDVAVNTAPLFDDDGQHIGEVAVQRDITAAKDVERELRRAKEAAEATNAAKSEFLANMSHEIRTPLNGVLGLTALVLDTELTREQRADLELVQASGKSLMTIINDVLDFSKIEAGQLALESIEFAPADSIADMVKMMAPRAHEKGLELIYDAPELPPLLLGDPGRLRQIVVNLVGNAIKFTERGEVAVSVSAQPEAGGTVTLRLSVRDNGIGIPKDKHEAIFHAFTQADASTTRRYGGTGLGLTISSQLARLMGGAIRVDSEPGQGSTFICTIACGVPLAPATAAPARDRGALARKAALVVSDNAHSREALVRQLAGWGMLPAAAADPQTALAMLSEAHRAGRPYPLLLLDMLAAGSDGFALAERAHRAPHLAGALIVLSGVGQRGDAARCRELGVSGYLTKPVRPSDLFDAVAVAFGVAAPAAPLTTRHSLRAARLARSILVAEDNEINQMLAERLLTGLGHEVHLANNGREALEAIERDVFDLVLMDMQMPVMGGLAAAAAIRSREAGGATRLPIVALTANAMQGDREACLAAGMDDYLTKPFSGEQIAALIKRWLPEDRTSAVVPLALPGPRAGEPAPAQAPRPLDVEILKSYVGDDDAAVDEFLRSFLDAAAKAAGRLHTARRDRRADALHAVSHSFKSSARTVGALALGDLCEQLEALGKVEDWRAIDAALARFDALLAAAAADAHAWLALRVN